MKIAILVLCVLYLARSNQAKVLHSDAVTNSSKDHVSPHGQYEDLLEDLVGSVEDSMIGGGYDTISLPRGGFEFTIKVGIINQKGTVACTGGSLRGLQTIRRSSTPPIRITTMPNGDYRVTVTLNIPQASVDYSCGATFMGISPSFTVTGSVSNIKLALVLNVGKDGSVTIVSFGQEDGGSSNFNVAGLPSVLQPIIDQITSWVDQSTSNVIAQVINQTIANFLGQAVADMVFPYPPVETLLL